MGVQEMQIVFDNAWATYYAGGTVSGRFVLQLNSPKKVRDITVKFKGECSVKWTEQEQVKDNDGNDRTEQVVYSASESYFENKFVVVGGGGAGDVEVPAGEHVFPFQSILPPTLPSSFESEFGHIRYTVKVVLNRPWKFDQEAKAAFTVISPVDLNFKPDAKIPLKRIEEKNLGCCCFQSGLLKCVMDAPCSGYVSGQTIPISLFIDNVSDSQVTGVDCVLRKVVTYQAKSPTQRQRINKVDIADVKLGGVPVRSNTTMKADILIPPLPPSNLYNCSLIDLKYEIKTEVKLSGLFNRNVVLKAPIIFGTVPLVEQQPVQNQPQAVSPSAPPVIGWSSSDNKSNAVYPDLPPPTFEEAAFGRPNTIRDQHDSEYIKISTQTFAPRYPSYQFAPPSAPLA